MNELKWNMPPIEFVMDNAASHVSELEERLKVADMGPDFEPTPLGHVLKAQPSPPHEQRTTESSRRSDVENLGIVPGPGGSMELVTSETVDHTPSFAEHKETWNGSCEDALLRHPAEESAGDEMDNKNTDCRNIMSPVAESQTVTTHDSVQKSESSEANTGSESEFRSDIFGLDHARLWQQVLQAKRKSENRSYKLPDELMLEFSAAADSRAKYSTRDVGVASKMKKSKKSERVSRKNLLSWHYHNNQYD